MEYGKPNALFNQQFKRNASVFAAFKTHKEQKELISYLLDENGDLRSFHEFKKATKHILRDYNRNYLSAEYYTAVRSARMGEKWQDALKNQEDYPNIEYMPSRSAEPRETHKQFYHIIRPIDDPFWDTHLPPNDWNCLCSFKTTAGDVTDLPEDIPPPAKPFAVNPGKEAKIVDRSHPYYPTKGNLLSTETYKWVESYLVPLQSKALQNASALYGTYQIGKISFNLGKRHIKKITNKPIHHRLLRNEILIGLDQLLQEAKHVLTVTESKARPFNKAWHYYKLKYEGFIFYLNVVERMDGVYYLDSITDQIKKG